MKVQELMTRDVATVQPHEGLDRAARSMHERDRGFVVVVDECSRVEGVLTDRDICMAALWSDRPLSSLRVARAMSSAVHSCRPDDSIAEAERRMGQHQVRRLPVVDREGCLQGVLSLDDVAREAVREQDLIAPPVSAAEAGKTLGQVSRPHLIEDAGDTRSSRTGCATSWPVSAR